MILRIYFRRDLFTIGLARTYQGTKSTITTAADLIEESGALSTIENPHLAKTSSVILLLTIAGFIISEFLHFLHIANIGLSVVALLGAGAIYLVNGGNRKDILRRVDYSVLVFFAAMFVVTYAL
jgi:Na+/H+ antiporter NhaD/arsenite permease-like protein